eukprot:6214652-Pleurochrysis_carterae.AAC.4
MPKPACVRACVRGGVVAWLLGCVVACVRGCVVACVRACVRTGPLGAFTHIESEAGVKPRREELEREGEVYVERFEEEGLRTDDGSRSRRVND